MDKQVFYESFPLGEIEYVTDVNLITESIKKRSGRIEITLPVGVVNKPTGNGRTYERAELTREFKNLYNEMKSGSVHGTHGKHPETFYVSPDEISHLVTEAWIDSNDFIWNKWVVLNTTKGKDLTELFLGGAKIGVSIRGKGVEVTEQGVKYVREYNFGGTDTVGFPSTGIMVGITVPKVEVKLIESNEQISACKNLIEMYEQTEAKTLSKENLSFEREQINEEDDDMGALDVLITKMDNLVNVLSGKKEEPVTSIKEEFENLANEIKTVLSDEKNLREKVNTLKIAVEAKNNQLKSIKQQYKAVSNRVKKQELALAKTETANEMSIAALKDYSFVASDVIEELRNYCLKLESVIDEFTDTTKSTAAVTENFRAMIYKYRDLRESAQTRIESLKQLVEKQVKQIEEIKATTKPVNIIDKAIHNSVGVYLRRYPILIDMKEELYQSRTVNELKGRVLKYLKHKGFNANEDIVVTQSIRTEQAKGLRAIPGWR